MANKCIVCKIVNTAREFHKHPNRTTAFWARTMRWLWRTRVQTKLCEVHQDTQALSSALAEANTLSTKAWNKLKDNPTARLA